MFFSTGFRMCKLLILLELKMPKVPHSRVHRTPIVHDLSEDKANYAAHDGASATVPIIIPDGYRDEIVSFTFVHGSKLLVVPNYPRKQILQRVYAGAEQASFAGTSRVGNLRRRGSRLRQQLLVRDRKE